MFMARLLCMFTTAGSALHAHDHGGVDLQMASHTAAISVCVDMQVESLLHALCL
jgi:hypothetical protein